MATADQIKEAARRRKANERARKKGMPEPYATVSPVVEEAQKSEREAQHLIDVAWAMEQDASGHFYKSECRPAIKLLAVYEGNNHVSSEDTDLIDPKTGKRKKNIPNPSIQAIRIRAIETVVDGVIIKIDPNLFEYKHIREVNQVVSFREWLDLRDKARKNLFWLGRLLGCSLFHNTHQAICDKFVQKNFDGLYFSDFTRDDVHDMIAKQERYAEDGETPTRTLMLFAPRSGYKSTIDGLDVVQWMLNCPDIRVLIMTSVKGLAKLFLMEIKRYFYLAPRAEPTAFHLLFPEFILSGVDGRSKEPIRCPAENFSSKEPHVWITSMDASSVGSRCDIRKMDDVVEDKNSADEELRESLKEKIKATNNLVEGWGFTDVIGTRYFTVDWYGWRMSKDEDGNEPEPYSYLSISAWTPKAEFKVKYDLLMSEQNGIYRVTEDMVDLWFPTKLSFKFLRTKLKENKERVFRNQQLNIATDPTELTDFAVHFDKPTLRAHTYASTAAPADGETLVTIDWAYSETKTSDYSVLAAINRYTRPDNTQELIVKDIDYDKWKSSVLAERIVLFLRKHKPNRTLIEKANGHDLLLFAMTAFAKKYGCEEVLASIRWIEIDNSPKAKANRIKCLEILLADDRLHFVAGPWIDELYKQFENFTGEVKKGRKDDFPDCISIAAKTLPSTMFTRIALNPEDEEKEQKRQEREERKRFHYEQYFGNMVHDSRPFDRQGRPLGGPNSQAPKMSQWRQGRRSDTPPPPVEPAELEPVKPKDPRMKIFGNKGPWRL